MNGKNKVVLFCLLSGFALCVVTPFLSAAFLLQENAAQAGAKRIIGAIQSINSNAIVVTPDSGAEVTVTLDPATRIRRIAPGERDLSHAAALQPSDLQVGDRVLVGGKFSDDGKSLSALSVLVMKRSDVEAKQQQEQQDWQKRGTGGLVCAVDASAGTVRISAASCKAKTIAVKTSKATVFRRYSPNSVKFDDARPSSLQEIREGDQLRARGDRSGDGSEVAAQEVVTGAFRNIAGVITAVDASSSTISVLDLLSKKPVQIKFTNDSQLHKLPTEMAQRMAMRLKASSAGAPAGVASSSGPGSSGANGQGSSGHGANPAGASPPGGEAGGMGGGIRQGGGAPDLNQMIGRTPVTTLAELNKGDAVIILATEGSPTIASTAITLVSGVEPILRAAPNGSQAMTLSAWNLGGPTGDAGNQ